jgi:hypothetical protein
MVKRVLLTLAVLLVPPLVLRLLGWPLSGSLLGMPYNFLPPTPSRIKQTVWNRESNSLVAPHVYGWGYSVNLYPVARWLGLVGRG